MLELQNISYMVDDDDKEILRDINLAFDGKVVAITGPNGSGKSTLAKILATVSVGCAPFDNHFLANSSFT